MRARATSFGRWWLLVALGAAAVATGVHMTAGGAGASTDSVVYLSAARSLLAGDGLIAFSRSGGMAPLTFYPPLYPIVLAALSAAGPEVLAAARVLSVAAFATTSLVIAGCVGWTTRRPIAAGAAGVATVASVPLWSVHGWALTEPLFLLVLVVAVWTTAAEVTGYGDRWWIVAGIAAGAAALTRYAGVAVVVAVPVAIVILGTRPRRARLLRAAAAAALGGIPSLVWLLATRASASGTGGRTVIARGFDPAQLRELVATLRWWIAPRLPVVAAFGVGVVAVLVIAGVRRPGTPRERALLATATTTVVAYGVVLVVNDVLLTSATGWNNRILAPVYILLLLVVPVATARLARRSRTGRWIAGVAAVGLLAAVVARAAVESPADRDRGFFDEPFSDPVLIGTVERSDAAVWSNFPDAIYLLTGVPARGVPQRSSPHTGGAPAAGTATMDDLVEDLGAGALLVWFDAPGRDYLVTPDEIMRHIDLEVVVREDGSAAYAAGGSSRPSRSTARNGRTRSMTAPNDTNSEATVRTINPQPTPRRVR